MIATKRGFRLGPFSAIIDEEVESLHMKFLHELPPGLSLNETIQRFNVNVPYSGLINAVTQDVRLLHLMSLFNFELNNLSLKIKGLFAENKDKLIANTLNALKEYEPPDNAPSEILEHEFHALRRLVASKSGYKAFTNLPK